MGDESPTALLQVGDAAVCDRRVNHDTGDAGLGARRVFEDEVFDVDATLAELTKKASERAGFIRDQNLDLAIPRGAPPCLPGIRETPWFPAVMTRLIAPTLPPRRGPKSAAASK